ncbi:hypothetical protein [Sneathiella glossodoripedis]|uniref:hypothetical protein n=1 Tax=Sneathiella glossodoripedis TaxID=418853 RepID=UPI00046EA83A|nr:hypothetical protein [Sneathiella glossodoripedis]
MLVKHLRNGRGPSLEILNYLLSIYDAKGQLRVPAPKLVHGNPHLVGAYIDASPHQLKYTSMVLSFAPGDKVQKHELIELIEETENLAFAGIPEEWRPPGVWVRHTHTGSEREEYHFVYPRRLMDPKERSYNIYPPGEHDP